MCHKERRPLLCEVVFDIPFRKVKFKPKIFKWRSSVFVVSSSREKGSVKQDTIFLSCLSAGVSETARVGRTNLMVQFCSQKRPNIASKRDAPRAAATELER